MTFFDMYYLKKLLVVSFTGVNTLIVIVVI